MFVLYVFEMVVLVVFLSFLFFFLNTFIYLLSYSRIIPAYNLNILTKNNEKSFIFYFSNYSRIRSLGLGYFVVLAKLELFIPDPYIYKSEYGHC